VETPLKFFVYMKKDTANHRTPVYCSLLPHIRQFALFTWHGIIV